MACKYGQSLNGYIYVDIGLPYDEQKIMLRNSKLAYITNQNKNFINLEPPCYGGAKIWWWNLDFVQRKYIWQEMRAEVYPSQ